MTTVYVVPNSNNTFRPHTTADEAVLRSFGAYDNGDPATWTAQQYRAFARSTGLRIVKPI